MAVVYTCPVESNSRTFCWCEQTWFVKHSPVEKIGPGLSTFHFKNVELGSDNSLRMWVRNVSDCKGTSGVVSSAEIQTVLPLGYGLYQVDVHGSLTGDHWDHLVFGFFTYDFDDHTGHNKEIDIEIGTFNRKHDTGGVFSNHNNTQGEKQLMNIHPSKTSFKHQLSIEWETNSITWSLINLEDGLVLDKLTTNSAIPSCDGACFVMNLWQFKNIISDKIEQNITLKNFKHTPLKNFQQKDLQFVYSLNFEDNDETFAKGIEYKHKKVLLKAKRRMTNVKLWINQSENSVEVKYPTGKDYAMLNCGIDIKGGQTDFTTFTLMFLDGQQTTLQVTISCDQFKSPSICSLPIHVIDQ